MDDREKKPTPNKTPRPSGAEGIAQSWQEITGHCQQLKGSSKTRRAPLAKKMHAILENPDATAHEHYRARRWREVRMEKLEAEEMRESDAAAAARMQAEMDAAGFSEAPQKQRMRRIPGAHDRLDARHDDGEPPLDAPETHADRERLREHLTRHPSATGPESAGR